jgi:hypothetical protein
MSVICPFETLSVIDATQDSRRNHVERHSYYMSQTATPSSRGRSLRGALNGLGAAAVTIGLLSVGHGVLTPAQASSVSNNRGDVWVDNVGRPAGPGHEMDPHLACADINIWGNDLAGGSGTFTVDGWRPSGAGLADQAWPGTAAHPATTVWTYAVARHGDQITGVINVRGLIADAIANGDTAQPIQGFHFKLQFSQFPQKHKTFWVRCAATTPAATVIPVPATIPAPAKGATATSTTSTTVTPGTGVGGTSSTSYTPPAAGPSPTPVTNSSPVVAVMAASATPTPTAAPAVVGAVLAVSTVAPSSPNTGAGGSDIRLGIALLLVGLTLCGIAVRRRGGLPAGAITADA